MPFRSGILPSSGALIFAIFLTILGTNSFKHSQAALVRHSDVESAHIRVGDLVDSCLHHVGVLSKQILVARPLGVEVGKVSAHVAELAALAVNALEGSLHEALAQGLAVLAGDVSLLNELVLAVGEGAIVAELAFVVEQPVFADLGLLLLFVAGFE